ncbi:outer membrane lipoprotein chaperone LolA [Luteimonas sp. SX5]|uniref:Outer-membrane lipoprotein carrier protein n=1 Tax=Luteimonas galliterrae TaxID=2940486 RepID=A0ABT0MFL5_9GAMM|nr:outer membrane lipoprotein chaperone LolA [Luteimonas galliterrae]MCL1633652.1 outer membrane lipoprotein chaperone LolA [Luteimonas galliterrae]
MKRVPFLAACAAALFSLAAMAAARDDLTAFTRGLKGLDGQFVQKVYDPNGKLKESTSGRVAMAAPRQFRWEYLKPHPQLIVADGKKVWVYDPDLQQVTVRPQGVEEQNSPLAALIDTSKLDRDFAIKEAGSEGGLEWLLLTPRNQDQASFESAKLGFGPGGLAQMQVIDAVGQRTEIAFSGWKRNPGFAKDTFAYTPPKGVDVIGEN